jgi:tetratricopeptide (TPR) repeat protein
VTFRWRATLVTAALALSAGSCAYYNTLYLARKYYHRGTAGLPYVADKPEGGAVTHFNKSIDFSKKVIAHYPRSKWVDDAYLLWARSLIGKDDPLQTMTMLRDFPTRYPDSPLKEEALFYLGVAGRKARKYPEAYSALTDFLARAPRHELVPHGHLEQARVLVALGRHDEAVQAATRVIEGFPKSEQRDRAIVLRAEALLAQGRHEPARADYQFLGSRASTDEERFSFLLKEADCLEAGRRYDEALKLLGDAASHEQEPLKPAAPGIAATPSNPAGAERWGRLQLRIGTAHLLAGRREPALESYRRVVELMPRTLLAAEAQYRLGYAYETVADDFEAARAEYAKVQSQSPSSPYTAQAQRRLADLERLGQYRSQTGADSVGKKVEAAFLLAELYLFQLDKPERALEEYARIAREHAGSPHAAKAMNAQAWVLREKLRRSAGADSLLWAVVHDYPATEAQLAARDYLERAGHAVPPELIKMPERPPPAPADTARRLTPPPAADSLAWRRPVPAGMDSLLRLGLIRAGSPEHVAARAASDSLARARMSDTLRSLTPGDSLRERLR